MFAVLQGRYLGGSGAFQAGVWKWKLIDTYADWESVFGFMKN